MEAMQKLQAACHITVSVAAGSKEREPMWVARLFLSW